MARTNLPISAFVVEGSLTDPAGTTIDQANGMNVVMTSEAIPPAYDAYRGVFIRVHNTAASAANFIVRAGSNPPAMRASLGDLTTSVAASATVWFGPLDMSRHAQSDDSINIDFGSGFTGTVTAFVAPANV